MVNEKLFQNTFYVSYVLLFVFRKVLVFIQIKVKLPKVRKNLLEQKNLHWDYTAPKNTCF